MDNVLGVSLRRRLTPAPLLGRMNAAFRFMRSGAPAVGSAVAGVIGEYAGVRAALWVGGCCLAPAFVPLFLSPVRTRRELPQGAAAVPRVRAGAEKSRCEGPGGDGRVRG
ncbi:hypothetical protein ACWDZ4_09730 [Streptomyces sp. NPDC003016]